MFYNGLGMESKLNVIEMRKFKTKEELVEWIETMHLQNTNGRETKKEMFRLGIEAAIEELTEFNLLTTPDVVVPKGTVCNHEWTQWKAEGKTLDGCTKCGLIVKQTAL
tara:strand:- start:98 stop:421 length:324 start_codon:yes stop_codon:yes gene_type:complete